jgi:hypothetical protein
MVVHLEPAADFDGLAVFWGIGNTKTTAEECAKHCWEHRPHAVGGEQLAEAPTQAASLTQMQHVWHCSRAGDDVQCLSLCSDVGMQQWCSVRLSGHPQVQVLPSLQPVL